MARFTCDIDALKKSIAAFGQGEQGGPGSRGLAITKTPCVLPRWESSSLGGGCAGCSVPPEQWGRSLGFPVLWP